jgi:hypothetical protein
MIRSVGTLYAIQDLFDHLDAYSLAKEEFLSGFQKYGTSTAQEVYQTATQLSWICTAESGQIVPTLIGKEAHKGSDRAAKLRCQLEKIIETTQPPWAALLPKGRSEAIVGFPEEIRQCFEEALLLGAITDDVIAWWSRSAATMRFASQRSLIATGLRGEIKTLRFEELRTKRTPEWQGFESAYAGYDVLSARDVDDPAPLKIEVKASDRSFRYATIYITEHEWITSTNSRGNYCFHIWLFDEAQPRLFIVESSIMSTHVPINQCKGRWRNAAVPLGAITRPSEAIVVPN